MIAVSQADVASMLGLVALVVAVIGGVWTLFHRCRVSFAEAVEGIVCKHVSPVRDAIAVVDVKVTKLEEQATALAEDHIEVRADLADLKATMRGTL